MILVNISAVCTSTTLTLIPVSSSHFGPEKFSGSSAWRPASQTMVTVLPLYFCASRTAISAAVSAIAAADHIIVRAVRAPAQDSFLIGPILLPPITANPCEGLSPVTSAARQRAAAESLLPPALMRARGRHEPRDALGSAGRRELF